VHTKEHLDKLRLKCESAGSTATRFSTPAEKERVGKKYGRNGDSGSSKDHDGDTFVNKNSFEAAGVGFAAVLQAVDAVVEGKAKNAFVACRPPGHHVGINGLPAPPYSSGSGYGFCVLNYVAGGAKHAIERWGLSRCSVIDIDLHHGKLALVLEKNGTG